MKQLRRDKTPAEQLLWQHLRRRQLLGLKFRDQHVIAGFLVDFCAADVKLVVEVDGDVHEQQRDYDEARTTCLRRLGITVVRVDNDAVLNDTARVLDAIHSAVDLACAEATRAGKPATLPLRRVSRCKI